MDTDTDPKVHRWKMTIQEFDCFVEHIPGTDNVVADGFSRVLSLTQSKVSKGFARLLPLTEEELSALYDFGIPIKHWDMIKSVHNPISCHHGVQRTIEKLDKAGHN